MAGGWRAAALGLGVEPLYSLIGAGYRLVLWRTGPGGGEPKLLAAIGGWLGWTPLLGAVLMALAAWPDWAVMVATSRKKIRLGPIFVRPE